MTLQTILIIDQHYHHHTGIMQIWNTIHKDWMYCLASLYLILSINFANLVLTSFMWEIVYDFQIFHIWINLLFSLFWQKLKNGTKKIF